MTRHRLNTEEMMCRPLSHLLLGSRLMIIYIFLIRFFTDWRKHYLVFIAPARNFHRLTQHMNMHTSVKSESGGELNV